MVAIVAGNGLGLGNTSAGTVGRQGVVGSAGFGRGGESVYVNAANGNLVMQRRDELVKSAGIDLDLVRTYNSQGVVTGANGDGDDNWRIGFRRLVTGLIGTANAAGSSVIRVEADGTRQVYSYDAGSGKYVGTEGGGSYDTLTYSAAQQQWSWTDGNSRVSEVYSWASGTGRLQASQDLDGNGLTYSYNASGRLTDVVSAKVAGSIAEEAIYLGYDDTGRLTSQSVTQKSRDSAGVVSASFVVTTRTVYGYDTLGRLKTVTVDLTPQDLTDAKTYVTTYSYDTAAAAAANADVLAVAEEAKATAQSNLNAANLAYDVAYKNIAIATDQRDFAWNYAAYGVPANTAEANNAWGSYNNFVNLVNNAWGQRNAIAASRDAAQTAYNNAQAAYNSAVASSDYVSTAAALAAIASANVTIAEANYNAAYGNINIATSNANAAWSYAAYGVASGTSWYNNAWGRYNFAAAVLNNDNWVARNAADSARNGAYSANAHAASAKDNLPLTANLIGSITQSDGSKLEFAYVRRSDGKYAVSQIKEAVTGSVVRTTSLVYDTANRKTSITDALGNSTTYTYDAGGQLTHVTGPAVGGASQSVSYSYDASGNMLTSTDARGNVATYEYDSRGNLTLVRDAAGNTVKRTYGSLNELLTETRYSVPDPDGAGAGQATGSQTARYVYDDKLHLRYRISAEGRVTEYLYDGGGRMVSQILESQSRSAIAAASAWANAAAGDLATRQHAAQAAKDAADAAATRLANAVYQADLAGANVYYTQKKVDEEGDNVYYTQRDQVDPAATAAASAQSRYDAALSSSSNRWNSVASHFGENIGTILGFYVLKYWNGTMELPPDPVYLSMSASQASADPYGKLVLDNYLDAYPELRLARSANDAAQARLNKANADLAFYQGKLTDARNGLIYYQGLQVQANAELSAATAARDSASAALSQANAALSDPEATLAQANAAVAAATTMSALLSSASADPSRNQRSDYSYDFRGNIASQTRWTTLTAAGVGVADGQQSVTTYVYDPSGLLLQTVAPGQSGKAAAAQVGTFMVYDGLNRVLSIDVGVAGDHTRQTLVSYDDANNRTVTTLAGGQILTETYNKAGELLSTAASSGAAALGTSTYSYDARGQLKRVTDPNGIASYMLYDAAGRKVADIDGDGSLSEYTWNATDKLAKTTLYASRVSAANLALLAGDIDAGLSSVALASIRPPVNAGADQVSWSLYDTANRLSKTIDAKGFVSELKYDGATQVVAEVQYGTALSAAQLAQLTTASLAGDASASVAADSANDRKTRFFYDADGLRRGTLDPLGYLSEVVYNAAGQVVHSVAYATASSASLRATGTLAQLRPQGAAADKHSWNFVDGQGRLMGELDAEGYLTEYRYDLNGSRTLQTRYATKAVLAAAVTSETTLASLRPAAGAPDQSRSWTYTDLGQVATQIDAQGTVTRYSYDDKSGQLLRTDRAFGTAEVRSLQGRYDTLGRLVGELSAEGSAWLSSHPQLTSAQIEQVWKDYGKSHTYDAAGQRTSTTDANGRRSLYYYNRDGQLSYSINALGEVAGIQYDAFGQVGSTTSYGSRIAAATLAGLSGGLDTALTTVVNGLASAVLDSTQTFTWDVRGQLKTQTDALGNLSQIVYNAFREEASTTEKVDASRSLVTAYAYDQRGQRIQATVDAAAGGLNLITRAVYDAFGRVTKEIDARGTSFVHAYDRLDQEVRTELAKAGDSAAAIATTQTSYDAFGGKLTQTDGNGQQTTYAYSLAERSMSITTPEGARVVTVYNRHGQTLSVTDARSNTSTFTYDANGKLKKTELPAAGGQARSESRAYDRAGQLLEITDARGIKTTLDYDAAGREFTRTVDAADGGLKLTTTYSFDAKGQALTVTDPKGSVTLLEYDLKGQLKRKTVDSAAAGQGRLNLVTAYTYDAAGHSLTETDPAGKVRRTEYDVLGRVKARLDATGAVTAQEYDANGNVVKTIAYADRVAPPQAGDSGAIAPPSQTPDQAAKNRVSRVQYDAANRPTLAVDATGAVTAQEYDANGNAVKTIAYADRVDPPQAGDSGAIALPAQTPDQAAKNRVSRAQYDAVGRPKYEVDATGAVTQIEYDAYGNVVKTIAYADRVDPPQAGDSGAIAPPAQTAAQAARNHVSRVQYDAVGRPEYAVDGVGAVTKLEYDVGGKVVSKTAYANAIGALEGPQAVVASAADRTTLYEYDQAGRRVKTTLPAVTLYNNRFDSGTPGSSAPVALYTQTVYDAFGNAVVQRDTAGHYSYSAYDAVNAPAMTVDAAGGVTRYERDALGNVTQLVRYKSAVASAVQGAWAGAAQSVAVIGQAIGADKSARVIVTAYDQGGRATEVRQATLSADGTFTESTLTHGAAETINTYNAFGQLESTQKLQGIELSSLPGGAAQYSYTPLEYHFYDQNNKEVKVVDQRRYVSTTQYDAFGNVIRVTQHANALADGTVSSDSAPALNAAQDRVIETRYDLANRVSAQVIKHARFWALAGTSPTEKTQDLTSTFAYDAFGNCVQSTDAMGRVTTLNFDQGNRATKELSPRSTGANAAPLTVFTYNVFGEILTERRSANGSVSTPGQADDYAIVEVSGPLEDDRTTSYTYDAWGRKSSQTNANGVTTTLEYDSQGLEAARWTRWTTVDESGIDPHRIDYTVFKYDEVGRKTHEIKSSADGLDTVTVRMRHNTYGELTAKGVEGIDDGFSEKYTYYDNGDLHTSNAGDGVMRTYRYDLQHRVTEISSGTVEATRHIVRLDYGLGPDVTRQTSVIDPDDTKNPKTTMTYDRWGNQLSVTNAMGATTEYSYDHANRKTSQQLGARNMTVMLANGSINLAASRLDGSYRATTHYLHDAAGQRIGTKDARGNYGIERRDENGKVVQELHADGGSVWHTYNLLGDEIARTDAMGNQTLYEHDKMGNTTRVTLPEASSVHRLLGEPVALTQASTLEYKYDELGRKTDEKNQGGEHTTYLYDHAGNVHRVRSKNGDIHYGYDALHHKISESVGELSAPPSPEVGYREQTWKYDYFGKIEERTGQKLTLFGQLGLLGQQNDSFKHTYTYNEFGKLEKEVYRSSSRLGDHTSVGGDITSTSGEVNYTYDLQDQVTQVTTRVYHGGDDTQASQQARYNYRYNLNGQRTREEIRDASDHLLFQFDREYDATGLLTNVQSNKDNATHSYDGDTEKADTRIAYTYDENGSISSLKNTHKVWHQGPTDYQPQLVESLVEYRYNFDSMNRLSRLFSLPEKLLSTPGGAEAADITAVSYDKNGLRTEEANYKGVILGNPATGLQGSVRRYTWDALSRLKATHEASRTVDWSAGGAISGQATGVWREMEKREYDTSNRQVYLKSWHYEAIDPNNNNNKQTTVDSIYDHLGHLTRQNIEKRTTANGVTTNEHSRVENTYTLNVDSQQLTTSRSTVQADGSLTGTVTDEYRYLLTAAGDQVSLIGDLSTPESQTRTVMHYDFRGQLVQAESKKSHDKTRTYVNNFDGQVVLKLEGGNVLRNLVVDGEVLLTHGKGEDPELLESGNLDGTPHKGLDVYRLNNGFQTIDLNHPGSGPQSWRVNAGDTLRAIAWSQYGDASLWYLIADANGLAGPDLPLTEGMMLTLPASLGSGQYSAQTHRPYDAAAIHGDFTPYANNNCGQLQTLVAAVIVGAVAAFITGGLASSALAGLYETGALGAGAATLGSGAASGTAYSGAQQGVMMAAGQQQKFSWRGLAEGAVGGALFAGAGAVAGVVGADFSTGARTLASAAAYGGAGFASGAANGAISGRGFSWREVAASAASGLVLGVGGTLGAAAGGALGHSIGSSLGGIAGGVAGNLITNRGHLDRYQLVSDITNNLVNGAMGGKGAPRMTGRMHGVRRGPVANASPAARQLWIGQHGINRSAFAQAASRHGAHALSAHEFAEGLRTNAINADGANISYFGHNSKRAIHDFNQIHAARETYQGALPESIALFACKSASDFNGANLSKQVFDAFGGRVAVTGFSDAIKFENGALWGDGENANFVTYQTNGEVTRTRLENIDLTGQGNWLMLANGKARADQVDDGVPMAQVPRTAEILRGAADDLRVAADEIDALEQQVADLRAAAGAAPAPANGEGEVRRASFYTELARCIPGITGTAVVAAAIGSMAHVGGITGSSANGTIPIYSLNGTDASQVAIKQGLNTFGMMLAPYAAFALGHNRASVSGLAVQSAVRILTLGFGAYGALKLNMAANPAETANFYQALGGIGISPALFDFAYVSAHGLAQAGYPIAGALKDGTAAFLMKKGSTMSKLASEFSVADQEVFVEGINAHEVAVSSFSTLLKKGMPNAVLSAHAYGGAFALQAFIRSPMLDALKISGQHSFPDFSPLVGYGIGFQIEMSKFLIGHLMNKAAYASGKFSLAELTSPAPFRTGLCTLWASRRVTAYHVAGDIVSTAVAITMTAAITTYLNPRSTQQFDLEYLVHFFNEVGPYAAMKHLATNGGKTDIADPSAPFQYAGAVALGLIPGAVVAYGLVGLMMFLSLAGGSARNGWNAGPQIEPQPRQDAAQPPAADPEEVSDDGRSVHTARNGLELL